MNKVYPFFLLLVMISFSANAQSTTEVELILSTNSINAVKYYSNPLKITNSSTIIISGSYTSGNYVLITPLLNYSIILKPTSISTTALVLDPLTDVVTGIKVKPPGGGGGGLPTPPTVTIYPNPVQTDLNFTITNSLVTGYSIYDLTTILKITQTITPSNTGVINVASLTNGTYILRLNINNGQQLAIQFIKN
jgi:hypothetical protein